MKKSLKIFSFAILFMLTIIFTKDSQAASLSQLAAEYPTGSHWNGTYNGYKQVEDGYAKVVATECAGFAALMYNRYYGIDPYENAKESHDINSVQAGDIVRYANNGHSVWIIARNGNTVQVAECNYDSNGSVRWNQTKNLSELSYGLNYIYKAPYVLKNDLSVLKEEPVKVVKEPVVEVEEVHKEVPEVVQVEEPTTIEYNVATTPVVQTPNVQTENGVNKKDTKKTNNQQVSEINSEESAFIKSTNEQNEVLKPEDVEKAKYRLVTIRLFKGFHKGRDYLTNLILNLKK